MLLANADFSIDKPIGAVAISPLNCNYIHVGGKKYSSISLVTYNKSTGEWMVTIQRRIFRERPTEKISSSHNHFGQMVD